MDETWLASRMVLFIPVLLSLSVHEWAHAYAAHRLGDDTAKHMGRLTLDPLAHMDPIGTLILPMLGIPFGWAKPVPVEPLRFRGVTMAFGVLLTAAAGPASNIGIALLCVATLGVVHAAVPAWAADGTALRGLLTSATQLNLALAFFNLLPVPPLDGSRVADGLVSGPLRDRWSWVHANSRWVLAAVILVPRFVGIDLFAGPRAVADVLLATTR